MPLEMAHRVGSEEQKAGHDEEERDTDVEPREESGEAALRQILQNDFALILLDVQMPRIDGYELAGLIRSRPR